MFKNWRLHSSSGRHPATFHITDTEKLKGFRRAPNNFNRYMSGQLFSLDVETVYTSKGQAAGRVTMVDQHGMPLVDALVKPEDTISWHRRRSHWIR
ncbi:unnamed protein product [Caenorhabditis sp. 36 PRJEB53466]|nr:unnamed protein product [Caenorhabditis sp. 36 PRJEB53466]